MFVPAHARTDTAHVGLQQMNRGSRTYVLVFYMRRRMGWRGGGVSVVGEKENKRFFFTQEEEIINPIEKKPRKRGFVWNYFVPSLPDRAQCTFCSADISYKGKSTNNLLRHLRTKHSEMNAKNEVVEQKVENCMSEDGSTYYLMSAPSSEQFQSPIHSPSPLSSSVPDGNEVISYYF